LGVGAGGENPAEFAAAGVDPRTRFRRLDEGLEVLHRLFAGGPVDFEGSYATLSGVALNPPTRRPGGPPIWLGGRKTGALRRAARYAQVWLPYMVTPEQVGAGLAEVRGMAGEYGRTADAVSAALFAWTAVDADSSWARSTGIGAVSAAYSQDFSTLADRYLLIGTPDAVVERLSQFAAVGVDTVLIQIAADSAEHRSRIIETFASRVLPAVRSL
jgi:alkanesulfonate monooxygenase SsuD/methylene tetrahydromethanopterin reductase-like flavin-dependent oxidoreductase (luciferase family)